MIPFELINSIVMMSIPTYRYMNQLKYKICFVELFDNYTLINHITNDKHKRKMFKFKYENSFEPQLVIFQLQRLVEDYLEEYEEYEGYKVLNTAMFYEYFTFQLEDNNLYISNDDDYNDSSDEE